MDYPYVVGSSRPYVYRQLVPLLTDGIELLGIPNPYSMLLVMAASGVGFYLALRKLMAEFYDLDNKKEGYLLVSVLACLVIFYRCYHPYDLMTAWLFTLTLYYFWTDQKAKHLFVFTLSCINRETSFLLILFYVAFLPLLRTRISRVVKQIGWMTAYQVVIYLAITLFIRWMFAEAPGSSAIVEPLQNIQRFASYPYWSLSHILGTVGMGWWMSKGWMQKPVFLRYAFGLWFPLLMVMYLIFGQAFEIRVFWEIAPVAIILLLPRS
jgi:hypothetical protein